MPNQAVPLSVREGTNIEAMRPSSDPFSYSSDMSMQRSDIDSPLDELIDIMYGMCTRACHMILTLTIPPGRSARSRGSPGFSYGDDYLSNSGQLITHLQTKINLPS